MNYWQPAIVAFRSNYLPAYKALYLRAYKPPLHLSRTLYKSALFMQNKPNFQDDQMNVNIYYTKAYKNETAYRRGKNKPNSNPNKPNFPKAKMNVNSLITKDYRKNDAFAVQKNKPNSNPISERPKMNANVFITKDYENDTALRPKKTNPKQTQSKPMDRKRIKTPYFPYTTIMPNLPAILLCDATQYLINISVDTLAQIWNLRIFHSIISHRNTSLTSASPMPEITKTDE